MARSSDLQNRLAFLPVAGAEFVGLKSVENPEDFGGVAADGKIIYRNKADDVLGIDDEGSALSNAFLRIENSERFAEFALYVRKHRERKFLQIRMVSAPGEVHELGIRAAAQNLRITILEIAVQLAKSRDFGRADEGEVLRPK